MNKNRPLSAAAVVAATATVAAFGSAASATTPPGSDVDSEAMSIIANSAVVTQGAPVRFELGIEFIGLPFDFGDEPFMTGQFDGVDTEVGIDMTPIFDSIPGGLPPEFDDAELTLDMRFVDGTDIFLKGGLLDLLADLDPRFEQFGELGDGWGSVEESEIPEIDELLGELGGAGGNPIDLLALLEDANSAEVSGTETIEGEELTKVVIMVPADALEDVSSDDDVFADLDGIELPIEVYFDAEGYPRQMVISLTDEALQAAAEADDLDLDDLTGGLETQMTMTVSYSDFNDPSIAIDAPTDAVDVTDAFEVLNSES